MAQEQNNNYFDLVIPIRPYLKKYIASSTDVDPFVIKLKKCHFSGLILEPIKKGYIRQQPNEVKHLTDRLTIRMTSTVQKENKFTIDSDTILMIDQRLKNLFEQHLCDTVSMNMEKRGDILIAIKKYREFYDITEDDLKQETVVKMFYRSRTSGTSKRQQTINAVCEQLSMF